MQHEETILQYFSLFNKNLFNLIDTMELLIPDSESNFLF